MLGRLGSGTVHVAAVTVYKSVLNWGPTDVVKTFESGWESCVLAGGPELFTSGHA